MKKTRNLAAIRPQVLPMPGARVGSVCGPGEYPEDCPGTVLCHVTDRWGTHASVLWDSGTTGSVHGLTNMGIGVHLIAGQARPVGYTEEYEADCTQHSMRIVTAPDVDLDGTFQAYDLDEMEFVSINGWLWRLERVSDEMSQRNI